MVTPIFVLSLPRSGSTLLQRLISTHPAVATASEPWFLLPLFLGYRNGHLYASYRQRQLALAFSEFLDQMPDGLTAYRAAVRRFAATLYEQACGTGQSCFLDKTPRYSLIAEDLIHTFPNARFILLWRNPLAIAASCINTWGRWNLYYHRIDFYHGLASLVEMQRRHRDRLFILRYEDLVTDPEAHLPKIFHYLGLDPVPDAVQRFKQVRLIGTMGDKKGDQAFSGVSMASRDSWPETLATLPRRIWARSYLRWLGRERLLLMGYELDDILAELSGRALKLRHTFSDLARICYGHFVVGCERDLFRKKRALARQGIQIDVPSE